MALGSKHTRPRSSILPTGQALWGTSRQQPVPTMQCMRLPAAAQLPDAMHHLMQTIQLTDARGSHAAMRDASRAKYTVYYTVHNDGHVQRGGYHQAPQPHVCTAACRQGAPMVVYPPKVTQTPHVHQLGRCPVPAVSLRPGREAGQPGGQSQATLQMCTLRLLHRPKHQRPHAVPYKPDIPYKP